MSKAWGNIGAWAADAEQAEAEEKEAAAAAGQSFPSLKESVGNTKVGKKKNKMTLQEFTMQQTTQSSTFSSGGSAAWRGSAFESKGLTPDEMRLLPTGPKERSAEEMQYGRLGGGFSSYGRSGGPGPGRMRDREGDGDGNWGGNRRSNYGGGFDDDRRGPPSRVSDFDQPSRADEVDNWAMTKKAMASNFDSGSRPNRYASLGTGGGNEGFSRADEVDNWVVGKKQQVSVAPPPRSLSNFGSTFRDFAGGPGGPDVWTRGERVGDDRERPRLVLDKPSTDRVVNETNVVKTNKPNPFGAARPREEILAEKGVDWKKVDLDIDAKKTSSRPTSSHSSRPESVQSGRSEGPSALHQGLARPKVNPFGDAKPREVLLEAKGLDWRKIDLNFERCGVDRPETDAEKNLKEEIEHLKSEFEKESTSNANGESLQVSGEEQTSLHDIIFQKEKDLEQLTRELDDKVRFGEKPMERPGSGAGRVGGTFPERPPSQSGSYEESRGVEFMERPRSRGTPRSHGTGNAWARPGDDKRGFHGGRERGYQGEGGFQGGRERGFQGGRERGFQGGRERGFLGNRDLDRSRERW